MCGFIGFSGNLDNKEAILQKMMDRIVHRGPDMGGMYTDDGIALGFRRLSILDLSDAGAQPMANEDKSVVVVFNGEIYNFMELRRELEMCIRDRCIPAWSASPPCRTSTARTHCCAR